MSHFPRQATEEQLGLNIQLRHFLTESLLSLHTASSNFQSLISSPLCLPQSNQENRQHDYQPISQMGKLRHRCESTSRPLTLPGEAPLASELPVLFREMESDLRSFVCSNTKSGPGLDVSSRPLASFHLFPQVSEKSNCPV